MKTGPVILMGAGGIFLWSSFHGASVTGSLRDLISGKQPASSNTESLGTAVGASSSSSSGAPGDTSAHSASAASNQALAKILAAPFGWSSGQEWADLVSLWNQESGWSTTAKNPGSGATGIPQLNPNSHPIPAGWSSATVQIMWGLHYIKSTYGSPSAAWAHEQANGWY